MEFVFAMKDFMMMEIKQIANPVMINAKVVMGLPIPIAWHAKVLTIVRFLGHLNVYAKLDILKMEEHLCVLNVIIRG